MKTKISNFGVLLASIAIPVIGGGLVGIVTNQAIPTWYATLQKPVWNPPNWLFGPAWTTLYALMGVASWLVWKKRPAHKNEVDGALRWYGGQLGLNFLWSILFFSLRSPGLALLEIGVLWVSILVTITKFFKINRWAAGLLAPYQLWVTFAAALNAAIWWLNRN